jgi:hypothetical protein
MRWCAACALTLAAVFARAATEPEALAIQCIVDAGTVDTGEVWNFHDLPGAGVLIKAEEGLFLAHAESAQLPGQFP